MTIRPMVEDDRERVVALVRQSFNQPASFVERMRTAPVSEFRVLEERGGIVAAAAFRPMGHFYGGRSVPGAGISSVAVAADARGRRLAEKLVGGMLEEARPTAAVSGLYPATVPLYRRLGYEFAALHTTYRLPMDVLTRFPGAPEVASWDDDALDEVADAYRDFASQRNGMLDRTDAFWKGKILWQFGDAPVYRVLVREQGRVTGSLVYTQENDFHFDLRARDLFWSTPPAGRALITFVARHRSLGKDFLWTGAPAEPMPFFTAEDHLKTEHRWHLMLRILDVPVAIAARGYELESAAPVEISVDDPLFEANRGPWRISVSGGKGTAEPATRSEVTLTAGALSSMYSGLLSLPEALRCGLVEGDTGALSRLAAIFRGPVPWTIDFF